MVHVRRYEDNGDAVNNLTVYVQKTDKSSIEGYGGPDKFLGDVSFLLGEQVFKGARVPPAVGTPRFHGEAEWTRREFPTWHMGTARHGCVKSAGGACLCLYCTAAL